LIEYVDKITKFAGRPAFLRLHHGKIAAAPLARTGPARAFRRLARPGMNCRELPVLVAGKALNARSEEVHGSEDKFPGFIHRLGHAVQERLAG
jgi:hypothetical protein